MQLLPRRHCLKAQKKKQENGAQRVVAMFLRHIDAAAVGVLRGLCAPVRLI